MSFHDTVKMYIQKPACNKDNTFNNDDDNEDKIDEIISAKLKHLEILDDSSDENKKDESSDSEEDEQESSASSNDDNDNDEKEPINDEGVLERGPTRYNNRNEYHPYQQYNTVSILFLFIVMY